MEMLIYVSPVIGDAESPNLVASFYLLGTVVKYLWLFSADKYWED
jgi:hypothetical protein